MKYFGIKDWAATQHYKDRNPPWIKVYNSELDSDNPLFAIPDDLYGQFCKIRLLASRRDNTIFYNAEYVAEEIQASGPVDLDRLAQIGLIIVSESRVELIKAEKERVKPGAVASKSASEPASKPASKSASLRDQRSESELNPNLDKTEDIMSGSKQPAIVDSSQVPAKLTEKQALEAKIDQVIEYFRETTGKNRVSVKAPGNRKFIKARLRDDGIPVGDLLAVIDLKTAQVNAGKFPSEYLRIETLFSGQKCQSYLAELDGVQGPGVPVTSRTSNNLAALSSVLKDDSDDRGLLNE